MSGDDPGAPRAPALVWALLPAKSFSRAKSRLAGVLEDADRAALARAMLEHVLDVLGSCSAIGGVTVVTDGDDVAELARRRGALAVRDAASPPLGAIVDAALAGLAARSASRALVLMSDLPLLTTADVHILVDRMAEVDVVTAPDLREEGTNALGLTPPDRLRTSFGVRDSFDRHVRSAQAAGLRIGVHRSEGLGFDVDEPADLERLLRRRQGLIAP